jgi:hypothetical protein
MTQQSLEPTLFELTGDGVQITYSTRSFEGPPQFRYNDRTFTGGEIRTQVSELGMEVSVTLQIRLVDVGGTVLTLLLPEVILGETTEQSFQTLAILTNRAEVVRPGAQLSYTVLRLQGTARLVVF